MLPQLRSQHQKPGLFSVDALSTHICCADAWPTQMSDVMLSNLGFKAIVKTDSHPVRRHAISTSRRE